MKKFLAKSQTVSSEAPILGEHCLANVLAFAGPLLFVGIHLDVENLNDQKQQLKELPIPAQLLRTSAEPTGFPRVITGVIALIGDCA